MILAQIFNYFVKLHEFTYELKYFNQFLMAYFRANIHRWLVGKVHKHKFFLDGR